MGGNEIAGYAASGALGLFVIVKGLSRAIRGWNGDRKDDKIDKYSKKVTIIALSIIISF